jgi:hypothetical protein
MFDCLLSFLSRAILQRNDFVFWRFEKIWEMSGSSPSCSLAGICAETNEANMNDFGHDGGQAGFPWSVRLKRLIGALSKLLWEHTYSYIEVQSSL